MNALDKLDGWAPRDRHCTILPALAAFAPMAIDAIGGATGGGGQSPSGAAPAPLPPSQQQAQETAVDTSVTVVTNVNGAPININIGGSQQADGSLGGGRYFDRGVDETGLYAPFGTLQSVSEARDVQWGGWMHPEDPRSIELAPANTIGGVPVVPVVIAVALVGAVGLALIKRKSRVR